MGSNNTDVPHFPVKIITKLEEFVVECRANMKVQYLKWKIFSLKKIEPKQQRLFFEGIELEEPDYELSLYGIEPIEQNAEFKLMLVQFYQGIPQTYFLDESHYDAKWNCSFEGITINKKESRGGKPYIPPIGCVRYGVKVLGKYENDTWLGGKGYRTEDEWPVAYHGTKELNVLEILRKGFLIEKGVRFAYGKGIYCSPDPRVALGYAHDYAFEDKNYKLIIQCRVDPNKLKIHGNYWLVTDEKHIRPYAICVFSENRIMELNKYLSAFGIDQFGYNWAGTSQGVVMQPAARVIPNPMPNVQPPPVQNVQIPPIQPIPIVQFPPVQPIPNVQFPPVQPMPNIQFPPMPQLPPMPNIQDIMRANLVGNALSKAVPNNSTQKK